MSVVLGGSIFLPPRFILAIPFFIKAVFFLPRPFNSIFGPCAGFVYSIAVRSHFVLVKRTHAAIRYFFKIEASLQTIFSFDPMPASHHLAQSIVRNRIQIISTTVRLIVEPACPHSALSVKVEPCVRLLTVVCISIRIFDQCPGIDILSPRIIPELPETVCPIGPVAANNIVRQLVG